MSILQQDRLASDIAEVSLLIDYISGRPDKHLCDLDKLVDFGGTKLTTEDVLTTFSAIKKISPTSNISDKQAAFILNLKDVLNSFVRPTKGLSIAYTSLFALGDGTAMFPPGAGSIQAAFPELLDSVRNLRSLKNWMSVFAISITMIAAVLLWQASYGNLLAARFEEANTQEKEVVQTIYSAIAQKDNNQKAIQDLGNFCFGSDDKLNSSDIDNKNKAPTSVINETVETGTHPKTADIKQLCTSYAYKTSVLCAAIQDVGQFTKSFAYRMATIFVPTHPFQESDDVCTTDRLKEKNYDPKGRHALGRQEDVPSLVAVLATFSNYFLPILFGLAGSMTALVRSIKEKISDSLLSPRDIALELSRLPLGLIAGACVGLFFTSSTTNSTATSLLGNFSLSASSIAFLAGYGAEGFFRAIDSLIERVFTTEKPT